MNNIHRYIDNKQTVLKHSIQFFFYLTDFENKPQSQKKIQRHIRKFPPNFKREEQTISWLTLRRVRGRRRRVSGGRGWVRGRGGGGFSAGVQYSVHHTEALYYGVIARYPLCQLFYGDGAVLVGVDQLEGRKCQFFGVYCFPLSIYLFIY